LDAGCGLGHGCRLLAEAGAREVVGVDVAEGILEAVDREMPERVRLSVEDVRALDHPDGTFDLVVCFETIDHIKQQSKALDELVRVLADDGWLVVSSFQDLAYALSAQLPHLRILRQEPYVSSAIVPKSGLAAELSQSVRVTPLGVPDVDTATSLLTIGGRTSLPDTTSLIGMSDRTDFNDLKAALAEAEDRLRLQDELVDRLRHDRSELQDRLLGAEEPLASVVDLQMELAVRERDLEDLGVRMAGTERMLQDVTSSASWRITEPLRAIKRALRP
jgi:SAM-dependent methyltransferase